MMCERTSFLAMVWFAISGAGMRTGVCSLLLCIVFSSSAVYAADDWTQRYPDPHPSSRYAHAMAYAGGHQVLLFGGMYGLDDTWVYDLVTNTWTQQSPSPKPWEREWHALAYIGGDQVLLFGGGREATSDWYDDTWVYDLSDGTWTEQAPSPHPGARGFHDMAYIGGDQVLLYNGGPESETWIYDLSADTWTCEHPSPGPTWSGIGYAVAYIGDDQVLLFGGSSPYGCKDETWVYDLSDNTWTQQTPSSRPSAQINHDMAYIGGDQVLLFGGWDCAKGNLADTWVYDLSDENWTQDTNTIQPSARSGHGLSETSMDGSSYLILFGGSSGGGETWTFGEGDYLLCRPQVTVVYPNGGELLSDTVTVNWIATDPQPGETALLLVDLEYSPNAGTDWYTIDTNQANDSSYFWDIPSALDGNDYLLRITVSDPVPLSSSDTSDAIFSMYNPDPPEVTVTHPNGGEALADSVTVTWTATDPDPGETPLLLVDLDYSDNAGASWSAIDSNQANDGTCFWEMPHLPGGMHYLVRIVATDTTGLSGSDTSDSVFTVHHPKPHIVSISDVPNDQGKQVRMMWDRSYLDDLGSALPITEYSIWRRAETKKFDVWDNECPDVKMAASIDGLLSQLDLAHPGDYFFVTGAETSQGSVWVFITTVPAMQFEQYAYDAPTECDSTAEEGMCWSVFFVAAHTDDPLVHFDSDADSGYSLDNIPPLPILDLQIDPDSWFTLRWTVPGEYEEERPISSYDIRYSTEPVGIDTQTWWDNAQACSGEGFFNLTVGEKDSFGVSEETRCHPELYFAVKALDERPNASGISNVVHFLCGDDNGDGIVNVGDIVYEVCYLFRNGPAPSPKAAGDVNCDGIENVGDIVYKVSYLYRGGPPPCSQ